MEEKYEIARHILSPTDFLYYEKVFGFLHIAELVILQQSYMKDLFRNIQQKRIINPKQVVWIAVLLVFLIVSSAVFEFYQSRDDLMQLMNEQASTITGTIRKSSIWNMTANEEIENLVAARLLGAARFVKRLDSLNKLDPKQLQEIAKENNLFRINIFDNNGKRVMSNVEVDTADRNMMQGDKRMDYLDPLFRGQKDEIIMGLKEARHTGGKRFAVALRRAESKNGAIVVNVDAAYMLEFREKMGLEKMVKDLAKDSGVGYITIQDENGIIASNTGFENQEPIQLDAFLRNVYNNGISAVRIHPVGTTDYFESVSIFNIESMPRSLLRIGMKTDELRSLEDRMINRGIITSLVLIIIGVIVVTFISNSQNLRQVERQYEQVSTFSGSILENMADGVISSTMDGTIKIFNRSAEGILGLTEEEVISRNLKELSVLQGLLSHITESLNARKPKRDVEEEIKFGNIEKIISVSTTFTKNRTGKYDSFTVVLRDLTEIKKMEAAAKHTEKLTAMGELASKVAHEVRNPLNAISMIAQRFKKEFKSAERQEEYNSLNEVMLSETKRVNGIIEQFLNYARPQKPAFEQVHSNEFIEEIKLIAESVCQSKGIEFLVTKQADTVISIDKELIKQMLLNLIFNSVESISKNGIIEFGFAKNPAGSISFAVSDNGHGINEKDIEHIFEIYFTKKPGGTGLGLSIAKQIAEQHGGRILVSSKPDEGTLFRVEIPQKRGTLE